jgi:hypothetical protein
MALDPETVKSALAKLRPFSRRIFGAGEHRFELNAPLSEQEAQRFEALHRIKLPAEYRHFVTTIGNGGAGPTYGFFPLGLMDHVFELSPWANAEGFVGVLSEPFPHACEWNDLSGKPEENGLSSENPEYEKKYDEFERRYWSGSIMNGAIPICHVGCALRIWLVLSGAQAGNLWYDKRADFGGIMPLKRDEGSPLTFDAWYQQWLDQCLRESGLS